jgi:hypothetical protein
MGREGKNGKLADEVPIGENSARDIYTRDISGQFETRLMNSVPAGDLQVCMHRNVLVMYGLCKL